jgi:hypothetical protein
LDEAEYNDDTSPAPDCQLAVPSRGHGDTECERDILVTLLAVVEGCVKRKRRILDGIEELRILEDKRSSANLGAASPSAQGTKNLRAWLLSNLVSTEESLESAQLHLTAMFGEI